MMPSDDALKRKLLLAAFQMPTVATMVSRKSSITNAFVNTLVPQIFPTLEEIEQALSILGLRRQSDRMGSSSSACHKTTPHRIHFRDSEFGTRMWKM